MGEVKEHIEEYLKKHDLWCHATIVRMDKEPTKFGSVLFADQRPIWNIEVLRYMYYEEPSDLIYFHDVRKKKWKTLTSKEFAAEVKYFRFYPAVYYGEKENAVFSI